MTMHNPLILFIFPLLLAGCDTVAQSNGLDRKVNFESAESVQKSIQLAMRELADDKKELITVYGALVQGAAVQGDKSELDFIEAQTIREVLIRKLTQERTKEERNLEALAALREIPVTVTDIELSRNGSCRATVKIRNTTSSVISQISVSGRSTFEGLASQIEYSSAAGRGYDNKIVQGETVEFTNFCALKIAPGENLSDFSRPTVDNLAVSEAAFHLDKGQFTVGPSTEKFAKKQIAEFQRLIDLARS